MLNLTYPTTFAHLASTSPIAPLFSTRLVRVKTPLALLWLLTFIVAEPLPGFSQCFVSTSPPNFNVGSGPQSVAVGDFNTDGKPDLATANRTSNNVSVLLNSFLSIATQPATGSAVCVGSSVSTSVSVSAQESVTYQWYKNSLTSPVASQTTATLSLTNVTGTDAGSYLVVVTGSCSATSTAFSLTVNALPTMALSATNVCVGSPLTLSATSGLNSYTFTSTSGLIGSGPANTTTVSGLTATTHNFTVTARDSNGCSRPRPRPPSMFCQQCI